MALFPVFSTHANATGIVANASDDEVTLEQLIRDNPDVVIVGTPKYALSSYTIHIQHYQDLYSEYGPNWRYHVNIDNIIGSGPFGSYTDIEFGDNSVITVSFG